MKKVARTSAPGLTQKFAGVYGWVILPSLLVILGGSCWLASLPRTWQFIGEHYSQIYYAAQAITAVACFIYGMVILILNRNALSSPEEWLTYIGWAFVMLFVMYVLGFSLEAVAVEGTHSLWLLSLKDWVFSLFSAGNNLLFLAAAFRLVDRRAFPPWSFAVQGGAWILGNLLYNAPVFYHRFPGVMASAFCIVWLGYALYVNIHRPNSAHQGSASLSSSIRRKLAKVVLIGAIAYFFFEIVFATNPLLAKQPWPGPLATIENSIAKRKENLARENTASSTAAGGLQKPVQTAHSLEPLDRPKRQLLDSGVFTALFFTKFIIFIAVFLLLLDAIIILSAHNASIIFKPIFEADREFLTHSGITRSIADAIGTTSVELYVKIPGKEKGKEKNDFVEFQWPADEGHQLAKKIYESDIPSFVLDAFRTGEEQRLPSHNEEGFRVSDFFPYAGAAKLPSMIAEPLIFHGAVIGCLAVTGAHEPSFSRTAVQKIRDLAKFVTLEVQSFRETASLEKLDFLFSRLLIGPELIKDFRSAIEAVAECLQDVLSPLAAGLWVDIGLQNLEHQYYAGEAKWREELRRRIEGQAGQEEVEVIPMSLGVKRAPKDEEIRIGKLALLVPKDRDPLDCPILGRNEIYRRTVITRTVGALIGITQEYLSNILQGFGLGLNQTEAIETEEWFDRVKKTTEAAGMDWVAIELRQGEQVFCSTPAIEMVEELKALRDGREGSESPYGLDRPIGRADHFIYYRRSASNLYFGVRSTSYSNNLAQPLWKLFLDRFADSANSSLERIRSHKDKLEHLQSNAEFAYKEVQHYHELANMAAIVGEMTHQISNTARGITTSVQMLRNALAMGRIHCASDEMAKIIERLPEVTDQLLVWTASFTKLSTLKEHRPCNLLQAALQSKILYGLFLEQRGADLNIDIDPSLEVDMPPAVITLAIANLVGNAKEVVRPGGLITITAQEAEDHVRCIITDDGPGIEPQIKARLFDRNVTTKSNGGGWGLHLTRFSLEGHRGSIDLVHSDRTGTTFVVYLPKYRRPELNKETV